MTSSVDQLIKDLQFSKSFLERVKKQRETPESLDKALEIYERAKINSMAISKQLDILELGINAGNFADLEYLKINERIPIFKYIILAIIAVLTIVLMNYLLGFGIGQIIVIFIFLLFSYLDIKSKIKNNDDDDVLNRTIAKIEDNIRILKLNQ